MYLKVRIMLLDHTIKQARLDWLQLWVVRLEATIKQAKINWRVLNWWLNKNCKNNLYKDNQPSYRPLQLFIEAEEHALM